MDVVAETPKSETYYEKEANEEETFYECYSDGEILRYKTLTSARETKNMFADQQWIIKKITITKEVIE